MSEERETAEAPQPGAPPDATSVNELWRVRTDVRKGWRGFWDRLADRLLGPRFEAQRRFNAAQVQLDNALIVRLEDRLTATHRRYDRLLTEQTRRLDEVDERHRLLEKELLRHVQDLVTRIDLILAEANREKLALAFALEDVRARVATLEATLRRK